MKRNTDLIAKFKLDRFSPLQEDAMLLNLDLQGYKTRKGSMFDATILAIFSNNQELILFYYLPIKGQSLVDLTINGKKYGCQPFDQDGFVQKYQIPVRFHSGSLKITEYGFLDDALIRTTRSVKEEHVFGVLDDQYYYDSKKYFTLEVDGELFYELIDMTTIKDSFQDLLGRPFLYRDIASIKANHLKLYYVAFNLYDHDKKAYFVPDDIVEMKVKYDEIRYVYHDKKQPVSKHIEPLIVGETITTSKNETIQKEPRKIEHGDKSQWNIIQNFFSYKLYQYSSIYKMSQDVKVKHLNAQNYTYALVIGQKRGYRDTQFRLQRGFKIDYDYDQTTLKHVRIYHITYQQKGHRYAVPVASMVYESDKKSQLPRFRNRLITLLKQAGKLLAAPFKFVFGAGGVLIKVVRFMLKHWKFLLILFILGVLTYVFFQLNGWFEWI